MPATAFLTHFGRKSLVQLLRCRNDEHKHFTEQMMWHLIGQLVDLIQSTMGSKGMVLIAAIGIPLWCAGVVGLFFGRKVHNTAAVIVGIVTGVLLAIQPLGALQPAQFDLQTVLLAVAFGIAGTLISMLIWRMAPALGIALVLLAVALGVLPQFGLPPAMQAGVIVALGAVGVLAGLALMEWSLVFSSSLGGALLVCLCLAALLPMSNTAGWLLFAAFASLGIWVQSRALLARRLPSESMHWAA